MRSRSHGRREPSLDDVEPLIEEALAEAVEQGVRGPAITPFVLARLHERSGGRTLRANRELIVGNAALAGEVAVALSAHVGRGARRRPRRRARGRTRRRRRE